MNYGKKRKKKKKIISEWSRIFILRALLGIFILNVAFVLVSS